MASIYGSVRLLPPGHAYLDPRNMGKFGIHHVIAEAANNLVLTRKNADQILIFFTMLSGVVVLAAQLVLLIYGLIGPYLFKHALAASIFLTPDPTGSATAIDLAFLVLDQVFGIPDMFCTAGGMCTAINPTLPTPFHVGFHEMLRFYSLGMLLIGVIIFLYYVVVIVGETATTGHPFGQRFQNIWSPIRLVMAIGLLVPINWGLNSGQYIVLYAAKFGSGLATNTWLQFNNTIATAGIFAGGSAANPSGERDSLLAKPNPPSIMPLVQAMTMVHACAYAYWKMDPEIANNSPKPPAAGFYIKPYLVKLPMPWMTDTTERLEVTAGTSYTAALDFYGNSDIIIRFGRYDAGNTNHDQEKGHVAPYCGDIRIPITYLRNRGAGAAEGGPNAMQEFYFNLVRDTWFLDEASLITALPHRFMELAINIEPHDQCNIGCGLAELPACGGANAACNHEQPSATARQALINDYDAMLRTQVTTAWNTYNTTATDIQISGEVLDRGWAGAGIWYNIIADINGAFITSITAIPTFESYPSIMEKVREERRKNDTDPSSTKQFNPNLADGHAVGIDGIQNSTHMAQKLNDFFLWWNKDDPAMSKADKTVSGGAFQDTINNIFGIHGLFAMRGENASIHPLAQLAALGKVLVDGAITLIGVSTISGGIGGALRQNAKTQDVGGVAEFMSGLSMSVAYLLLTVGILLYYVLPFLPFVYFFFAFGTWVKSIFEAMVGVPLWALAHLRLDGEGLPGDSASNGYFLIFEIFVRPILSVFGLIGGVLILTAQVRMLNVIWPLVISNLTGFEGYETTGDGTQAKIAFAGFKVLPKNTIDQFFFTVIYTMVVYMMTTASFKLIDRIPDQILRFMGAGVSSYSSINPDGTEGLTRYAAYGGMTVAQNVTGGLRGLSQSMGGTFGKELSTWAAKQQPTK
ncbi:MAG: DotA/TraY family protein [Alphaproteobacteria bacterium]